MKNGRNVDKLKTKTILTIGDGIAAKCLHFELRNRSDLNIINISANDFFTPCSENSTAMNCLRGTRANVTKLGDTILASMQYFEDFFQENKPWGIEEGLEYQILENKTVEKWERRYPKFFNIKENSFLKEIISEKTLFHSVPAYFINYKKLGDFLISKSSNITYKNEYVREVRKENNHYKVSTL